MILQPPIYVINLQRHAERRESVSREFHQHCLSFDFVHAIDGKALSLAEIDTVYRRLDAPHAKRAMSGLEVACFLSHVEAWREVARGRAPYAMICEDDVRIDPKIGKLFDSIEESGPQWDILRLYSRIPKISVHQEVLFEDVEAHVVDKVTMSTVGYLITKPAAKYLLEIAMPISLPLDGYLKQWWLHGLCSKQVWPSMAWPVHENQVESSLHDSREKEKPRSRVVRFQRNFRFQLRQSILRKIYSWKLPTSRQIW